MISSPSLVPTVGLVVAFSLGCDRPSDKPPSPLPQAASPSAPTLALPSPRGPTSVDGVSAPAASDAGLARNPPSPLTTIPETRSKVPTSAEWKAARELSGPAISMKQDCQVQVVREWLRLTCRKTAKSASGNNQLFFGVQAVTVEEGRDGETFTFVGKENDIGSVVAPLVRGKRRRAVIAYDVASVTVVLGIDWPLGAAAPTISVTD